MMTKQDKKTLRKNLPGATLADLVKDGKVNYEEVEEFYSDDVGHSLVIPKNRDQSPKD